MEAESVTQSDIRLKTETFPQDKEFRNEAETTKSRLSWDMEVHCFMDEGGTTRSAAHTHISLLMII